MKERLKYLIENALNAYSEKMELSRTDFVVDFISPDVIVPPISANDKVFVFHKGRLYETEAYGIKAETENGHWCFYVKAMITEDGDTTTYFVTKEYGKTAFASVEDVEKILFAISGGNDE